MDYRGEDFTMESNTFAQMSSIIMLKQLEILKDCKLRLMPDEDHEDIHFARILHGKTSDLVKRRGLTSTHAKNENYTVDEDEFNGLVYSLAKKPSGFCRKTNQDRGLDYQPSGLGGNSEWKRNCDCKELEDRNIVAWLGQKLLPGADGST